MKTLQRPKTIFLTVFAGLASLIPGYFGAQDSLSILTPFPAFAFLPLALLASSARNPPDGYWCSLQTAPVPPDARTFTAMRIVVAILPLVVLFALEAAFNAGQMNTPKRT
jgi:hypothetical protein